MHTRREGEYHGNQQQRGGRCEADAACPNIHPPREKCTQDDEDKSPGVIAEYQESIRIRLIVGPKESEEIKCVYRGIGVLIYGPRIQIIQP
ncbi:hypothetical protein D3C71_957260 [compost metagenome]